LRISIRGTLTDHLSLQVTNHLFWSWNYFDISVIMEFLMSSASLTCLVTTVWHDIITFSVIFGLISMLCRLPHHKTSDLFIAAFHSG